MRVENPRAWLLAIVRNAAFSWLARNRPKSVFATDDPAVFDSADARAANPGEADPETAMIAAADARALDAAIAALPHAQREVLVMRDIQGLTYKDIAAAIDAPIGTVMSRLARARAVLIAQLGHAS